MFLLILFTTSSIATALRRIQNDDATETDNIWFHIPKAGTSFVLPLMAKSCPNIPSQVYSRTIEFSTGADDLVHRLNCKCSSCGCSQCGGLFPGAHMPYDSKHAGRYFGMFRDPARRIISQYIYKDGFGKGWGDMIEVRKYMNSLPSNITSKARFLAYAMHPDTKSCQIKMLLGFTCVGNVAGGITTEMAQEAIRRVRQDFAFVGDTDNWKQSLLQLFPDDVPVHLMYNSRPGEAKSNDKSKDAAEQYLAALQQSDWHDLHDEAIFTEIQRLMSERLPISKNIAMLDEKQNLWWMVDDVEIDFQKVSICNEQESVCSA